ncbi:MAG: hypothetical protein JRI91_06635 [Deltaproteobacteria bacterium]|nr:hypothetical protein [Deltaproteobacteria bacterium]
MDIWYLLRIVPVLIAGVVIGRWFNGERKKLRAMGEPWQKTWLTIPGILIIIILCFLVALRFYVGNN